MNSVMLVGKMYFTDEKNIVNLIVNKPTPNEDGEYEKYTIPCLLFKDISDMCENGTTTGVRGELRVIDGKLVVFATKISFLSSKQNNE